MRYKLDLHTHSYGSPDGGLKTSDYRYFLQHKLLDYVAITDHEGVETALKIQTELGSLGSRMIIGQEVMTTKGEIIGLFLSRTIAAGLTPQQAVDAIKQQGGLVYVPHPFETVRSGMSAASLNEIAVHVDILETRNGRAIFQNRSSTARLWAQQNAVAGAASSDAHGRFGWGYTYSVVAQRPTAKNLAMQLRTASFSTRSVGWGVLYPKFNRLLKKLGQGT